MIGRLLTKFGLAGSTISGVVYLDIIPASNNKVRSEEDFKKLNEDLKTIEDIELFENIHGCNFVFVNHWDKKELYSARKFEEQNKNWKEKIFKGLNEIKGGEAKKLCKKNKGVVTLLDDRKKEEFRLGVPDNGW